MTETPGALLAAQPQLQVVGAGVQRTVLAPLALRGALQRHDGFGQQRLQALQRRH